MLTAYAVEEDASYRPNETLFNAGKYSLQ
jgi:hypothetical protein